MNIVPVNPGEIVVTVKDGSQNLIPGAVVSVELLSVGAGNSPKTTNSLGVATITGLSANTDYTVSVTPPVYTTPPNQISQDEKGLTFSV